MKLPELPLSKKEKKQLLLKNKRRFIVNSIRYFTKTGNLKKTFKAYKKAGVGLKEIGAGIFHWG
jgi:hypothetical protein